MNEVFRTLVVSSTASDAEMIRELLRTEFEEVVALGDPERMVEVFDRESPDILVLAFPVLKFAERYYLGLLRCGRRVREKPHRTVVLCDRDEVRQAYYLCRQQHFDDYVLFWPLSHDPHRLLMAVHHAARAVAVAGEHGPHAGVFALHAHELADHGHPPPPASLAGAPQPTVLLVDDDTFQHSLVAGALSGTEFQLKAVTSSADVFAYFDTAVPDVILMDFEMPGMNGVEIIRRLRKSGRLQDIPVLMLTGHSTREIVRGSLEVGVADFIVKPVEREALLRKLRAAVLS